LLDRGSDIKGPRSGPGLLWAMRNGKTNAVRLLLKHGADINITSKDGTLRSWRPSEATSMSWSCSRTGSESIARLLLKHGAEVSEKNDDGLTLLHKALFLNSALRGYRSVTQVLLDNGADPKLKDNNRFTPQQRAENKGHSQVLRLLSKHQARRSSTTETQSSSLSESFIASPGEHLDTFSPNGWKVVDSSAED
ncbi:ankyrin, partial [Thozetella sp. PMI_491]